MLVFKKNMKKIRNYLIYCLHLNVTNIIYINFYIARTSNGLKKKRYMEIHEVIEEVDEDKNNNNINLKKISKCNNIEEIENKKDKNLNIKIIKENNKIEEKESKIGNKNVNKFNQMYRSLALSKEKNKNKISISSCEKYDFIRNRADSQNKSKRVVITPIEKDISKTDNISKINLPLLNNQGNNSNILSKNKLLNNNYNTETPSTSAYTNSTKNNLRNDHNLTEQVSKFRIGLFSANTSSNNNAIIPSLPIRRPVSNFNFGGNQLWETDDKNKEIKNNNNEILMKKEINLNNETYTRHFSLNKFMKNNNTKNIFKNPDNKWKSSSNNRTENVNNNINLKFHKFVKEKDKDKEKYNLFNKKLIEYKKMSNHLNKSNNFFLKRSENRSQSLKKYYEN